MEAYRAYKDVISGNKLAEVIDLPDDLRTSELEILIFPIRSKNRKDKRKSFELEDLPAHSMGRIFTTLDRDSIYSNER